MAVLWQSPKGRRARKGSGTPPSQEEIKASQRRSGWVPETASGGIVLSPQVRMVGEAGPEAIIPLSKGGGWGGTTISVQGNTFYGVNARDIARELASAISMKVAY